MSNSFEKFKEDFNEEYGTDPKDKNRLIRPSQIRKWVLDKFDGRSTNGKYRIRRKKSK